MFTGWPGIGEILIIFVIVLIIFGPRRLPEMGKSLGRAIKEFRNAGKEIRNDIEEVLDVFPISMQIADAPMGTCNPLDYRRE